MSNYIFYHLYCAPGFYKGKRRKDTDWHPRLLATYNKIKKAKLLYVIDEFIININTPDYIEKKDLPELEGVTYTFDSDDPGSEKDTLNKLWEKAQKSSSNGAILYLHSKGVTRGPHAGVRDWVECMEYFLIENWIHCLEKLKKYDTVGCNLTISNDGLIDPHYSGNFWWANVEYLKRHHKINISTSYTRAYSEYWLLDNKDVNPFSMYNSNINHYSETLPREKYEGRLSKELLTKKVTVVTSTEKEGTWKRKLVSVPED